MFFFYFLTRNWIDFFYLSLKYKCFETDFTKNWNKFKNYVFNFSPFVLFEALFNMLGKRLFYSYVERLSSLFFFWFHVEIKLIFMFEYRVSDEACHICGRLWGTHMKRVQNQGRLYSGWLYQESQSKKIFLNFANWELIFHLIFCYENLNFSLNSAFSF